MFDWSDDDEAPTNPPPSTKEPMHSTPAGNQSRGGEEVPKPQMREVPEQQAGEVPTPQTTGVPAGHATEVPEQQAEANLEQQAETAPERRAEHTSTEEEPRPPRRAWESTPQLRLEAQVGIVGSRS